jgi:hypothetical protein
MPNNTVDVTNVKGVQGGYGFTAPIGTTLPGDSDPFATLGTGFENMGFISNDGVEEEIDADTDTVTDMNGDVVYVIKSTETETLVLTLISVTEASLKEMHGHQNVTSATNHWKVTHTAKDHDQRAYVFDLLLKDGRKLRKVVPDGQVTEVGTITYVSSEVYAREITITCMPDADGNRVIDYIQKAATTTTTGN